MGTNAENNFVTDIANYDVASRSVNIIFYLLQL